MGRTPSGRGRGGSGLRRGGGYLRAEPGSATEGRIREEADGADLLVSDWGMGLRRLSEQRGGVRELLHQAAGLARLTRPPADVGCKKVGEEIGQECGPSGQNEGE